MKKLAIVAVVATLVLLISAGTVLAKSKGTDRPFHGVATGTSTVTGGPAVFSTTVTGTFKASHLGKGTYTGSSTQDWSGADYSGFPFPNPCGVVDGTITLTAANGDMVEGDIDVTASTVCEVAPFNNLAYASTLVIDITGGTGRFVSATGRFTSTSTHTRVTVTADSSDIGSWSGLISY